MRVLLSVWDKAGIAEFAKRLHDSGFEIISTGQTKAAIESGGVPVKSVAEITGFPEILDGRVKTLHPRIHGALLARRDKPEHVEEIAAHEITPIDLVVSNLYPFSSAISRDGATMTDALENIDIGGPAMIRAAAKNFPSIIVLVDPADYDGIAEQIESGGIASVTASQRRALAAKAFGHVSAYDAVIRDYLDDSDAFPPQFTLAGAKLADLRYGENPHQRAAVYRQLNPPSTDGIAEWQVLSGREMSFLNYVDADSAQRAASGFDQPAVAIVKHASPCGIASAPSLSAAYEAALASDPVSAFGGIVALNRPVDDETGALVAKHHFDVIIAPSYSDGAQKALTRRKTVRLIAAPMEQSRPSRVVRQLRGGFLLQDEDGAELDTSQWRTVSRRQPTSEELSGLEFVWRTIRYVMSNAIVLGVGTATVGIGSGQPNRVDAVRIAIERAGSRARGSVLASDAYFPFADNIEVAAAAGISAIVEPGGSIRDQDVIDAADLAGIAMVFTGERHFRH